MRYKLCLIVLSILVLTNHALSQQSTAVEKLERLRLELIDGQGKEESLRMRAQQLDEDLKPENIARSLAGIGRLSPRSYENLGVDSWSLRRKVFCSNWRLF